MLNDDRMRTGRARRALRWRIHELRIWHWHRHLAANRLHEHRGHNDFRRAYPETTPGPTKNGGRTKPPRGIPKCDNTPRCGGMKIVLGARTPPPSPIPNRPPAWPEHGMLVSRAATVRVSRRRGSHIGGPPYGRDLARL